jgi:hypothetical protein
LRRLRPEVEDKLNQRRLHLRAEAEWLIAAAPLCGRRLRPVSFDATRLSELRLGHHDRQPSDDSSVERFQPYPIWLVNWFMSK